MAIAHRNYQVYACNHPNVKNEDRFSESQFTTAQSEVTVLGVYDGHGGRHCADYISTALPLRITQALSQNEENLPLSSILTASFKDVDDAIIQAVRNNFSSVLRWHMPRSARQKMIDVMLRRSDARESVLRAQSGSTALVAVIEDESITLANVGDCRAVIGRISQQGGAIEANALTTDQNGRNESERTRILNDHPASESELLFAGGRVFGHISTTRSFGDMFFKESTDYAEFVFRWSEIMKLGMSRFYPLVKTPPYLAAKPDITRHQRTGDDRFLVIASDGLWGLRGATDEWAVEKSQEGIEKGLNPAEFMMQEVLKFRPGDDVTIVVVVFSTAVPKEPEPELQNSG